MRTVADERAKDSAAPCSAVASDEPAVNGGLARRCSCLLRLLPALRFPPRCCSYDRLRSDRTHSSRQQDCVGHELHDQSAASLFLFFVFFVFFFQMFPLSGDPTETERRPGRPSLGLVRRTFAAVRCSSVNRRHKTRSRRRRRPRRAGVNADLARTGQAEVRQGRREGWHAPPLRPATGFACACSWRAAFFSWLFSMCTWVRLVRTLIVIASSQSPSCKIALRACSE